MKRFALALFVVLIPPHASKPDADACGGLFRRIAQRRQAQRVQYQQVQQAPFEYSSAATTDAELEDLADQSYRTHYDLAKKMNVRLAVFVGVPSRRVPGILSCQGPMRLFGNQRQIIVTDRGAEYVEHRVPGTATDHEIRCGPVTNAAPVYFAPVMRTVRFSSGSC